MTDQRTTTQKGLGWQHQKDRDALLRAHVDGTPCWWCGLPMYRDRTENWDHNPTSNDRASGSLAADHSRARADGGTKADRLLHGICNKQRQAGSRDHLRPAVTGQHPSEPIPEDQLGIRLIPWP
ncbi:hypothetical protein P9990_19835 [Prescottella equi]|uniref:hypothetical protein n=1 Tax=Rhodococcus hoagii TaxID=43767 RepID=UPI002576287C|nr:hypothetical protein [Prescottella equi]WJJ10806.1 hypothetical protein P9990_19835 [Prescottella equi]